MLEKQRAQVPVLSPGPAELRPFLEAPGPRREKGRGRPIAGADAAGERPFLWGPPGVSEPLWSTSPRTTPRVWASSDGGGGGRRSNLRVITVSSEVSD